MGDVAIGPASSTTTAFNPYKFSIYRTSALTSSPSLTVVAHDTTLFDTNNNADIVTNKGRYTAPVAGFYWFSARAGNTAATNTQMMSAIFKNGSNVHSGPSVDPSQVAGADNSTGVSVILQLAATDFVEHAFIGGNGSTMAVGQTVCWFQGFLVSRA